MKIAFRLSRFALAGVAACAAATAVADDYHYVNMLIGDRASGMGGAYTAVSDDATGLYYNPAGIVYTRGSSLSASVNAYHITNTRYQSVLGGGDWVRESSSLLPNFFGVVQPWGRGFAGFSYAVTDSVQENLAQHFTNVPETTDTYSVADWVINVDNSDATYKLGPSYALEIRDGLSLGASLMAHFRNTQVVSNQVLTGIGAPSPNSNVWSNSYARIEESGIEPVVSVMWNPLEKISLGATLRWTSVLNSSGRFQTTTATSSVTNPVTTISTSSKHRAYPLTLALGAAYFPTDRLLYSADFIYYAEADGDASEHANNAYRTKAATWNASAGMEYYASNEWAFRGGLFTSRANTPTVATHGADQPDHADLFGLSASVSHFSRSSSITGGFAYSAGEGKAQAIAHAPLTQTVVQNSTTFFLSTSYSY